MVVAPEVCLTSAAWSLDTDTPTQPQRNCFARINPGGTMTNTRSDSSSGTFHRIGQDNFTIAHFFTSVQDCFLPALQVFSENTFQKKKKKKKSCVLTCLRCTFQGAMSMTVFLIVFFQDPRQTEIFSLSCSLTYTHYHFSTKSSHHIPFLFTINIHNTVCLHEIHPVYHQYIQFELYFSGALSYTSSSSSPSMRHFKHLI